MRVQSLANDVQAYNQKNPSPDLDPHSSIRPGQTRHPLIAMNESEMNSPAPADLSEQVAALQRQVFTLLLALIVVSGTLVAVFVLPIGRPSHGQGHRRHQTAGATTHAGVQTKPARHGKRS